MFKKYLYDLLMAHNTLPPNFWVVVVQVFVELAIFKGKSEITIEDK